LRVLFRGDGFGGFYHAHRLGLGLLLTLKSILMFLMTFVVFSDVYTLSIDFEDYSAISIELLYHVSDPSTDFEDHSDVSIEFCILF